MTRKLVIVTGAAFILAANALLVVVIVAKGLWDDWKKGKTK
jgi:hypothetical protein